MFQSPPTSYHPLASGVFGAQSSPWYGLQRRSTRWRCPGAVDDQETKKISGKNRVFMGFNVFFMGFNGVFMGFNGFVPNA
jgi:hypothetical protein